MKGGYITLECTGELLHQHWQNLLRQFAMHMHPNMIGACWLGGFLNMRFHSMASSTDLEVSSSPLNGNAYDHFMLYTRYDYMLL